MKIKPVTGNILKLGIMYLLGYFHRDIKSLFFWLIKIFNVFYTSKTKNPIHLRTFYIVNEKDTLSFSAFVYRSNLSALDSTGCQYDYVEIFDGKSVNAPNLGRYCGGNMPSPIRSSTNELFLRFISDQTISHTGFVASYTAEPKGEYLSHFKTSGITLFIPCHRKYSQSEYRKAVAYSTV